ncbi:hypothetical protein fugu_018659 [Takifugu bimaculatus]|uniref:Uncharacterized protein n=1 Tax=Takifugu bimaculatus TaxID=433685 RepID=A0A4Z2BNA3_9TELE|nr:hypothetical protein fugu_018659 [Takifugu bimaculatus]
MAARFKQPDKSLANGHRVPWRLTVCWSGTMTTPVKPLGGPERRGGDGRGKMLQEGSQRLAANRPARDNGRELPQTPSRTERGQERRLAFGESQNNQRLKENLTASLLHVTDN